jgi:hypothetical protein
MTLWFSRLASLVRSKTESWWYAFEAFGLADRELRDADHLLRDQRRRGLKARRVKGANNPDELVRLVPVFGWRPVETLVHIPDIPRIVETFGGTSLYGEDTTAPVRELLQNAMDAIQATGNGCRIGRTGA